MNAGISIRTMTMDDYDQVMALWLVTEGMGMRPADERQHMARYLQRNPNLSFVAQDGEHVVGAVLGGHDGRRGYLQHLAVARTHRKQGLGRALVQHVLDALRQENINKCHLFVLNSNLPAVAFWEAIGWFQRHDLVTLSYWTGAFDDEG